MIVLVAVVSFLSFIVIFIVSSLSLTLANIATSGKTFSLTLWREGGIILYRIVSS